MIANLVIASNGATTLGGSSVGLSSPVDRKHFHDLRAKATAIVVGGKTFRNDPYGRTPKPLFVASRQVTPEMQAKNRDAIFKTLSPSDLAHEVISQCGAPVLVEGGLEFISTLIVDGILDQLFLTRTTIAGDGIHLFDEALLRGFNLVSVEHSEGERFEIWQREQ